MLTPPPPPPPPNPAKKGSPWLALIMGVLLLGSLTVNFLLVVAVAAKGGSSGGDTDNYNEVLVDGKSSASDKIVVITVKGVIMDGLESANSKGTFDAVRAQLKKIDKDEDVKAILLEVNSPGGGVTESDRIYNALKQLRAKKNLPIVVLFGDVAASGGYYISMASDKIIAHPTTITGSIGVISQFFNVSQLMGKVGVNVEVIKSLRFDNTESFKDMGSPYRPMKPAERKLLQSLISQMWERFTGVVAEGRKGKLSPEQVKSLADGRVFTGPEALELKLVDQIGYEEDAYAEVRKLAKSDGAKIVRYKREPSLADLFTMESRIPQPSVEEMLRKVTYDSPQFLYLWSSHLIGLQGVGLDYGGTVKAVEGVDLSVPAGQFLAVVGPSGSGKTSLLNLIGGLERPTAGLVRVGELDLGQANDISLSHYRSQQIGFVFQSFHLHPTRTALENTSIPLYFSQTSMQEGLVRCHELLGKLGLKGLEDRPVSRLSGGQRQRVAIARALVNRPQIVLADEPIGHLDGETAGVVLRALSHIHRTEKVTLLVVTHDLSILDVAERTVRMDRGRLVA